MTGAADATRRGGPRIARRILPVAAVIGTLIGVFFIGKAVGEAENEEETASADASGRPIDRRLDPGAGCDALASGIRAVARDREQSPEVRAVLLDGLLLNHRNLDCGIMNRSRLLLEIVGTGPTAPVWAPKAGK